jgi:hypothetical protein
MNKIIFHSNREYNLHLTNSHPQISSKSMPKWYVDAERYIKDPRTGEDLINYDGGKVFSFKTCPAIVDMYTSGYVLKTPCDIYFYEKNNDIFVELPEGFKDFCGSRSSDPQFVPPHGYDKHFHWFPSWSVELPKGYSAIYLSPVNHFDLPFITISGIIDNDRFNTAGLMPFFLKEGFTGLIPEGTPFVQIIPFKREDWESEIKLHSQEEILDRYYKSGQALRTPEGGMYKKLFWSRKKYK